MMVLEDIVDQIYYEIRESCALHDPAKCDFKSEEKTTIICAAHIIEELRNIKEALQEIRGLQLADHAEYVNGKGQPVDPGDLTEQPVYIPLDNDLEDPIPF